MTKNNPIPCGPNDLVISGIVLGFQNDSITYTSKKTGKEETLNRDVVILKCPFGVVICRFYNPSIVLKDVLSEGMEVSLPISQYQIENGLKVVSVRV